MNAPKLVCDRCIADQSGNQFSLWLGLNEAHAQALLDFSKNDALVVEQTSDRGRFSTAEKLKEWLAHDPYMYALTPASNPDELAGLIWFSPEVFPFAISDESARNSQWTFAIRVYESARGKRLSMPFMTKAFEDFGREHANQPVWLSTKTTNTISQKIYTQFGFRRLAEEDGRVFYVYNNRV